MTETKRWPRSFILGLIVECRPIMEYVWWSAKTAAFTRQRSNCKNVINALNVLSPLIYVYYLGALPLERRRRQGILNEINGGHCLAE